MRNHRTLPISGAYLPSNPPTPLFTLPTSPPSPDMLPVPPDWGATATLAIWLFDKAPTVMAAGCEADPISGVLARETFKSEPIGAETVVTVDASGARVAEVVPVTAESVVPSGVPPIMVVMLLTTGVTTGMVELIGFAMLAEIIFPFARTLVWIGAVLGLLAVNTLADRILFEAVPVIALFSTVIPKGAVVVSQVTEFSVSVSIFPNDATSPPPAFATPPRVFERPPMVVANWLVTGDIVPVDWPGVGPALVPIPPLDAVSVLGSAAPVGLVLDAVLLLALLPSDALGALPELPHAVKANGNAAKSAIPL